MSGKKRPKHGFSGSLEEASSSRLRRGPGSRTPGGEVISAKLRKFDGEWKTLGRVALNRTRYGVYSELSIRTLT